VRRRPCADGAGGERAFGIIGHATPERKRHMRILTVDDDVIALEMLNMALTTAGHEVVSASDGAQALQILREQRCRMVITDWKMPAMSGLELCQAIRADDLGGYIFVIILTGCNRPDEVVAGMSAGADDFIAKPFNPDELIVRVRAGERILSLETRDMVLFSLAKLAESRDPDTGKHIERVQEYCGILARWVREHGAAGAEIDSGYARMIFQTSPLHDVGKIGIPDMVLLKPGRLSDREFAIMKTHSHLGADTLNAALEKFPDAAFLRMARDIALAHHERFDGTGYPNGLAGADIPLCGRIVAIADVYDALTSKRVYKSAFSHEIARSILLEESGTHFDPELIRAFTETEEQFIDVRKRLDEPAAEARAAQSVGTA